MPRPPGTEHHTLYLLETCGDTLVVKPRGDAAGFTAQAVTSEISAAMQWAQSSGVRNLVVDLSGGNYFGSIVLGALVQLGQAVRTRGGRIALCGASSDMQDVLRLLKLASMWEMFETRRQALRAIAAIPLGERLWGLRKVAAAALVFSGVVWGATILLRVDYAHEYYPIISRMWREAREKRRTAGEEEWARYRKQMHARLDPIDKHLARRVAAGRSTDAELLLYYAIHDHWDRALDQVNDPENRSAKMVQFYLRGVEAMLAGRLAPGTVIYDPFEDHPKTPQGGAAPQPVPAPANPKKSPTTP